MIELILLIISLPSGDIKSEQCMTLAYNNQAHVVTYKSTEYNWQYIYDRICDHKETINYAIRTHP